MKPDMALHALLQQDLRQLRVLDIPQPMNAGTQERMSF